MRLVLPSLAALFIAMLFAPIARAQASIPYRRTIPYISSRPRPFSGRYVRISGSFGGPQATSNFGRSFPLTLQSTIYVPGPSASLPNDDGTAGDGVNDRPRGPGR